MTAQTSPDIAKAVQALTDLQEQKPLVQCITNFVAMNWAANVLLAAGAAPAMVHCAEESGEFAAVAQALTVNIGTLSPAWVDGMTAAIKGATEAGRPWVFDPVAHFATPYRKGVAAEILAMKPTILRGNASEILALSGAASAGRGADSGDSVAATMDVARDLARQTGSVVAVTGAEDFLTDGTRGVLVSGGSPYMEQVTAVGCSLTALMGAFAVTAADPFDAALGALMLFSAAGETAAATAKGPGSFAVAFLDTLATISPEALHVVPVRAA